MKGIVLALIFSVIAIGTQAQDATELVRRADAHARGKTSLAEISMKVIRPDWSREMSMRAWTKGNSLAMVQVLSPARERGIVYLKRSREVWNWIPSIERTIKLPPSMMSQSWMGSDFSNDDLVKEFSIVEDYTHTRLGEEPVSGRNCVKVQLIPKPEAAVVWGKVLLWIDPVDLLMMRAEYYDEEGELLNRMLTTSTGVLGGRMLPLRMEMIPVDKPGQKTVISYISLVFDQELSDDFFTVRQMQQMP